jgi:hypothetical protein
MIKCTLTNDNWSGTDCTPLVGQPVNNIAALRDAMDEGLVYFNLHTGAFPSGEVRGQMGQGDDASCLTNGSNANDDDEDSD